MVVIVAAANPERASPIVGLVIVWSELLFDPRDQP